MYMIEYTLYLLDGIQQTSKPCHIEKINLTSCILNNNDVNIHNINHVCHDVLLQYKLCDLHTVTPINDLKK